MFLSVIQSNKTIYSYTDNLHNQSNLSLMFITLTCWQVLQIYQLNLSNGAFTRILGVENKEIGGAVLTAVTIMFNIHVSRKLAR